MDGSADLEAIIITATEIARSACFLPARSCAAVLVLCSGPGNLQVLYAMHAHV